VTAACGEAVTGALTGSLLPPNEKEMAGEEAVTDWALVGSILPNEKGGVLTAGGEAVTDELGVGSLLATNEKEGAADVAACDEALLTDALVGSDDFVTAGGKALTVSDDFPNEKEEIAAAC